MKPTKQTVYIPVKVEDDATFLITKEISNYLQTNSSIDFYKNGKCIYTPAFITQTSKESEELEHLIIERLDKKELFVFTPEQLNEYTQGVIKQAIKNAAENFEVDFKPTGALSDFDNKPEYEPYIDKESIINTFEETFKQFEV